MGQLDGAYKPSQAMHTNIVAQKNQNHTPVKSQSHRYSLRDKKLIEPAASYYYAGAPTSNDAISYKSNNIPKKIPTDRQ